MGDSLNIGGEEHFSENNSVGDDNKIYGDIGKVYSDPGMRPSWIESHIIYPLEDAVTTVTNTLGEAAHGIGTMLNDTFIRPSGSTDEIPQTQIPDSYAASQYVAAFGKYSGPVGPQLVPSDPATDAVREANAQQFRTDIGILAGGALFTGYATGARLLGLPNDVVDNTAVMQFGIVGSIVGNPGSQSINIARRSFAEPFSTIAPGANGVEGLPSALRMNGEGPTTIIARDPVNIAAQRRLNGIDLDRNAFAPGEAGAAAEMENYLGGTLKRAPGGTSADYVVESGNFSGARIDFKLTPDTFEQAAKINTYFDKTFPKFSQSFADKLANPMGVDLMPFDTRFLTPANQGKLFDFINTLPKSSQQKVIYLGH